MPSDAIIPRSIQGGTMGNILAIAGAGLAAVGAIMAAIGAIKNNQETQKLLVENASLSSELYKYASGAESFGYLHMLDLGDRLQRAQILHVGKYPLRNVQIEIRPRPILNNQEMTFAEMARHFGRVRIPVVIPDDNTSLGQFPFPNETELFRIIARSESGKVTQMLVLHKYATGEWAQGYVVVRSANEPAEIEVVAEHFDDANVAKIRDALIADAKRGHLGEAAD